MMKTKSIVGLAGMFALLMVVGCSSKPKHDQAAAPAAATGTTSGATTSPVDLGASSSGRGL